MGWVCFRVDDPKSESMTELVEPRLGFRVVRIEVSSEERTGTDLLWSAWATDDDDPTVVLGYLRSTSPSGYGQARVSAYVDEPRAELATRAGGAERWIRQFVLEHLYDTARRAILAQAAAMDISLDIPSKAPEIDIEWLQPEAENA